MTKHYLTKTTVEDTINHRSHIQNLSSCEIKAWKKFRPERDSSTWPLRYQCSALPSELSNQLGASHVVCSQNNRRWWRYKWIYERSYKWTSEVTYVIDVIQPVFAQCFSTLKSLHNIYSFNLLSCVWLLGRVAYTWGRPTAACFGLDLS